jgi:hypothetical protein
MSKNGIDELRPSECLVLLAKCGVIVAPKFADFVVNLSDLISAWKILAFSEVAPDVWRGKYPTVFLDMTLLR